MQTNEEDLNPSAKRCKTQVPLRDVVSSNILDDRQAFTEQYNLAQPYSHCILPNVFKDSFFNELVQEIKQNSKVNFKESDLFKFYQSIDLANLKDHDSEEGSEESKSLFRVLQLRQVLYSDEWRQFIESIAGLPPGTLSQQVDCACNCHISGCHLLCHDDVIGTRKISYILYLTDENWTVDEGGALELYAADQDRLPTTVPAKCLLPTRNSMAFFAVEPGVSFHAVQEVFGERPRLSLQGWYHAKEPPANIQEATLQRLKNATAVSSASEYESLDLSMDEPELSVSDREFLSQYIDAIYLQPNALAEMQASFEKDSSIQLRSFLNESTIQKIDLKESRLGVMDAGYYEQGVCDKWKMTGPTHMHRFLEYNRVDDKDASDNSIGDVLFDIRRDLLQSQSFARFLAIITSLRPTGYKGQIRRFRPGLDYTVAHAGLLTESAVLDATLCFVAGSGKQQVIDEDELEGNDGDSQKPFDEADVAWQSGDVGGFECYIEADDDGNDDEASGQAADEYNQDDDTELLSVSAGFNTLSIVFRDPGTLRFVKYLSAQAPSSRWDVAMEYQVEAAPEDSEDEEDDKSDAESIE
jgi:Rps23 Pro-64 3,4-dihydroxylase Tpa1-like proline 4-hydroxylase